MRSVFWTLQAQEELAAIREFISKDSAHFAAIAIERLIESAEQAGEFPESGRIVPELADPTVREIIRKPYRIVYRNVGGDRVHILTVRHSARVFPADELDP